MERPFEIERPLVATTRRRLGAPSIETGAKFRSEVFRVVHTSGPQPPGWGLSVNIAITQLAHCYAPPHIPETEAAI